MSRCILQNPSKLTSLNQGLSNICQRNSQISLQHAATHWNTRQHTATHCNKDNCGCKTYVSATPKYHCNTLYTHPCVCICISVSIYYICIKYTLTHAHRHDFDKLLWRVRDSWDWVRDISETCETGVRGSWDKFVRHVERPSLTSLNIYIYI